VGGRGGASQSVDVGMDTFSGLHRYGFTCGFWPGFRAGPGPGTNFLTRPNTRTRMGILTGFGQVWVQVWRVILHLLCVVS
jgi:hypothetical protein